MLGLETTDISKTGYTKIEAEKDLNLIWNPGDKGAESLWRFDDKQWDAIDRIINKQRNTFLILPTGGGKSVCYQLPGMVLHAQNNSLITLVITPLCALIKDQVNSINRKLNNPKLRESGVNCEAVFLDSSLDEEKKNELWIRLNTQRDMYNASGTAGEKEFVNRKSIAFLYITPETLKAYAARFRKYKDIIRMVAIDEAHCISAWGSSFRPAYRALGGILKEAGLVNSHTRITAFTATCDTEVRDEICKNLGDGVLKEEDIIGNPVEIEKMVIPVGDELCLIGHTGENNQNKTVLRFEIFDSDAETPKVARKRALKMKQGAMLDFIRRNYDKKGVIFCATKKQIDDVQQVLREDAELRLLNHSFAPFYGGMVRESKETKETQERILQGFKSKSETQSIKTIVATSAFGMGIDIDDVDYVIHYSMPLTLADYIQQCGRAGRKYNAECVMYGTLEDFKIAKALISDKSLIMYPIQYAADVRKKDRDRYAEVANFCLEHSNASDDVKKKFQSRIESFAKDLSFEEKWCSYVKKKKDKNLRQMLINVSNRVNIQINLGNISGIDAAVADAVYTIWYNGQESFDIRDIVTVITGDPQTEITDELEQVLKVSLYKLSGGAALVDIGDLPISLDPEDANRYIFDEDALNCYPWAFRHHEEDCEQNFIRYMPYGVLRSMSSGNVKRFDTLDLELIALKHYILRQLEIKFNYSSRHFSERFERVRSKEKKAAYRTSVKTIGRRTKEWKLLTEGKKNELNPPLCSRIIYGDRSHKDRTTESKEITGIYSILMSVKDRESLIKPAYKRSLVEKDLVDHSNDRQIYRLLCVLFDNLEESNYITGYEEITVSKKEIDEKLESNRYRIFLDFGKGSSRKFVKGFNIYQNIEELNTDEVE